MNKSGILLLGLLISFGLSRPTQATGITAQEAEALKDPIVRAMEHCDLQETSRLFDLEAKHPVRGKFSTSQRSAALLLKMLQYYEGNTCENILSFLLKNGAKIEDRYIFYVAGASSESTKFLLDHGISPNLIDDKGRPLLISAIDRSRNLDGLKSVQLLIARKADVNAADKQGRTPLSYAVTSYPAVEMVRVLLQAGADPFIKDNWGRTSFDDANSSSVEQGVKDLLRESQDKLHP